MKAPLIAILATLLLLVTAAAENTSGDTNLPAITPDADADGVPDSVDKCPNTPAGTITVDYTPAGLLTYAGCNCEQVRGRVDTTNPCIHFFCQGTFLVINYHPYNGTITDCPPTRCDDYTYYGYPPDGYAKCNDGVFQPYNCTPFIEYDSLRCGYIPYEPPVNETLQNDSDGSSDPLPSSNVPGNVTPADGSSLPPDSNVSGNAIDEIVSSDGYALSPPVDDSALPTTNTPRDGSQPIPSSEERITEKFNLTDAEVEYSLTATAVEDDEQVMLLTFTSYRAGTNLIPTLVDEDGKDIPFNNFGCGQATARAGAITCRGTFQLPTAKAGERHLTLTYTYFDGTQTVTYSHTLTFTVRQRPFTPPMTPSRPVVSINMPLPATEDEAFVEEVRKELIKRDERPANTTQEAFAEEVRQASQVLQVQKEAPRYDRTTNRTKTTITITPQKGGVARNVTVIEYIPKEVAQSASQIVFSVPPDRILNDDPLIMWHFAAVDERIDLSYEVSGEVQVTGNTIVAAETVDAKGTAWHIILPMIFIPLLVIALIGIPRLMQRKQQ